MNVLDDGRVREHVDAHPHRLVFASLSGAHLYGFPSVDSDVDIRGAHVLPAEQMLGLHEPHDTYDYMEVVDGLEVDMVTYDLKKFCALLLNKNGNVLEQAVSPLILRSTDAHRELTELAGRCVTKHHVHHYRGMTKNRLRAFVSTPKLKPLLYALRAALTGIHLLRSGECQPDLTRLMVDYPVDGLDELIERKAGAEQAVMDVGETGRWRATVEELLVDLETAFEVSTLPEQPQAADEVEAFLVGVRMET